MPKTSEATTPSSGAFLSLPLLEKISQNLHEQEHRPGLYVVATPIGNILDITLRAIYLLKEAQHIFAEDTRVSKKLLNFYNITTPLVACHEYNEISPSIISSITKEGVYALISDAGTPLISDPGYRLVNWCLDNGIDVFPVPGACSAIAGLSVAGLGTDLFLFYGFLPPKSGARKAALKNTKSSTATSIFFESPLRLISALTDMLEIFGDRFCCVAKEITKIFEKFQRGRLSELIEHFSEHKLKGEFIIIVSGNKKNEIDEGEIRAYLIELLKNNSLKKSVEKASAHCNISRNSAYEQALKIRKQTP
ncbi:MAG: 16S rRNA (cytidine(1402)-2'-O)-methyltransferase [Holosporaceae bacterium]|jgi:16S rRNA (cytidine1402-2'-O)-methyltransferase|nr:16S rRNA (cytidine(1402)-2'-O)-methyltransferase [Holosporaceae bacterium]